jgi:hypothetical protein
LPLIDRFGRTLFGRTLFSLSGAIMLAVGHPLDPLAREAVNDGD